MMFDTGFKKDFRKRAWAEAVYTAAFLHDIFPTERNKNSAQKIFYGKECKWYDHLVEFGRIGIVRNKKKGPEFQQKVIPMIMVGYSLTHKVGSYRMCNSHTNKVVICDNVSWTAAKQWKATDDMKQLLTEGEDIENDFHDMDKEKTSIPYMTPIEISHDELSTLAASKESATPTERNPKKLSRMVSELQTSYNNINDLRVTGDTSVSKVKITRNSNSTNMVVPTHVFADDAITVYESKNEGGEVQLHGVHSCFNTLVQSDPGEPKSFKKEMKRPEA